MIAIVNPPNPPGKISNKDMMGGFGQCYPKECNVKIPPIDIPYVASVLRESSIELRCIDCLGGFIDKEVLITILKEIPADMVFIRTSTPTVRWDIQIAEEIRRTLNLRIIFFGPHVSLSPDTIINNPNIDAVVLGEPEFVIRDIVLQGFKDTPGVWYKENGNIVKNKLREYIEGLDGLPFPAWDMLPYMEYTIGNLMRDQKPTLFMQTSRGCPFNCAYCPYPVAQGNKYRKRSYQNVIDEFSYLVETFNVKNILIRDPEFTLDRERIVKICEGLISLNCNVSWRCETRIDTLDNTLLELMKKAGCCGVNLGIESASKKVCKAVGRKYIEKENSMEIIQTCHRLGIHTFCFYIVGLPGDNIKEALDNIMYAIDLKADVSQFTVATPYLGTAYYAWASERDLIESFELDVITGYEAIVGNEELTPTQIQTLRDVAQGLIDRIQELRAQGKSEDLNDDHGLVATLSCFYFYLLFFSGIRNIIVYGVKGITIAGLKKIGFNVVSIFDDQHQGMTIHGIRVLPMSFADLFQADAAILSPYVNDDFSTRRVENYRRVVRLTKLKLFIEKSWERLFS